MHTCILVGTHTHTIQTHIPGKTHKLLAATPTAMPAKTNAQYIVTTAQACPERYEFGLIYIYIYVYIYIDR